MSNASFGSSGGTESVAAWLSQLFLRLFIVLPTSSPSITNFSTRSHLKMCKLTSKHGDHGAKERAQLYNFIMKEDLEFGQCCGKMSPLLVPDSFIAKIINKPYGIILDRVCKSSGIQGGNRCFQPPSYFDWSTESFTKPMLWYHVVVLILQGIIYW